MSGRSGAHANHENLSDQFCDGVEPRAGLIYTPLRGVHLWSAVLLRSWLLTSQVTAA